MTPSSIKDSGVHIQVCEKKPAIVNIVHNSQSLKAFLYDG